MKFELDNTGIHLRAMRDTIDELRTWICGFNVGRGGQFTELSKFGLHLDQTRILLNDLMRQAEKKDAARVKAAES